MVHLAQIAVIARVRQPNTAAARSSGSSSARRRARSRSSRRSTALRCAADPAL